MNRNTNALRTNGYSIDAEGCIACRAGVTARHYDPNSWRSAEPNLQRLEQTWLVAIVVEVTHGDAREISDAILAAADSPRALVGKRRNGSAVLLFKCPPGISDDPATRLANRVEDYGTRDGAARFTLSILSEGATVDMSDYSWDKARSPLEWEHGKLPNYTPDVAALVTEAAKARCTSWSLIEREREDEANNAKYATMRIPTAQEEAERAEEELVARYEGQHVSFWDGPFANEILRCRKVVAARRTARGETAA